MISLEPHPHKEWARGEPALASAVLCEVLQRLCVALQRGNVPIVVGGTGLYLRWFVHGRPSTPRSDDAMAAAAQAVLDQVGVHQSSAQVASKPHMQAVFGAASWSASLKWPRATPDVTDRTLMGIMARQGAALQRQLDV